MSLFGGFLDNFFIISLGIAFGLILLLVYHFKQRMASMEKKGDTMYELLSNIVSELNFLKRKEPPIIESCFQVEKEPFVSEPEKIVYSISEITSPAAAPSPSPADLAAMARSAADNAAIAAESCKNTPFYGIASEASDCARATATIANALSTTPCPICKTSNGLSGVCPECQCNTDMRGVCYDCAVKEDLICTKCAENYMSSDEDEDEDTDTDSVVGEEVGVEDVVLNVHDVEKDVSTVDLGDLQKLEEEVTDIDVKLDDSVDAHNIRETLETETQWNSDPSSAVEYELIEVVDQEPQHPVYKKMNVSQLRAIAISSGGVPSEVNKMKKSELVHMLEKMDEPESREEAQT